LAQGAQRKCPVKKLHPWEKHGSKKGAMGKEWLGKTIWEKRAVLTLEFPNLLRVFHLPNEEGSKNNKGEIWEMKTVEVQGTALKHGVTRARRNKLEKKNNEKWRKTMARILKEKKLRPLRKMERGVRKQKVVTTPTTGLKEMRSGKTP